MAASSSCPGRGVGSVAPEHPATKSRGPIDMDDEYAATLPRLSFVYLAQHNKHGDAGMIGNAIHLFRFLAIVYGHIKAISHQVFQAFCHPSRLYDFHTSKEISGNQSWTNGDSRVLTLDVAAGSSRSITGGGVQPAGDPPVIIDSGATVHATGNRALLSWFRNIPAGRGHVIRVANGDPVPIRGIGAVVIPDRVTLNHVLFVPGLTKNIVSVSRLLELGYRVIFTGQGFSVTDAGTGELVGQGRLVEGLFVIDFLQVPLGRTPPA
ncbi:hypothetical protein ACQ4PT_068398 [Festuca glaucescens]